MEEEWVALFRYGKIRGILSVWARIPKEARSEAHMELFRRFKPDSYDDIVIDKVVKRDEFDKSYEALKWGLC